MSKDAVELASLQGIAAAQARQLRRVLHVLRDVGRDNGGAGYCFCHYLGDSSRTYHESRCIAARRELLALRPPATWAAADVDLEWEKSTKRGEDEEQERAGRRGR